MANKLVLNSSGIFAVRQRGLAERLLVGRAGDLRRRLKHALVESRRRRATDDELRTKEDLTRIEMRWALASAREAPFIPWAEIEAELLRRYVAQFGQWPKYNAAQPHKKPAPRKAA